ncbi:Uncharacterised protein [uncultured archaeon]|nr:Uncharacterised protein [uncultured archaeon]
MFEFLKNLFVKKKEKTLLKDPLQEVRLLGETKDAYSLVSLLKSKKAKFLGGGLYDDSVYYKEYAKGVYSFFVLRKERNTGTESILFDGHAINEKEDLGLSLESSYSVGEDLQKLGYSFGFERKVEEWRFSYNLVFLKISDIVGVGVFLEAAISSSKDEEAYMFNEKRAVSVMNELVKEFDYIDALTLELMSLNSKLKN